MHSQNAARIGKTVASQVFSDCVTAIVYFSREFLYISIYNISTYTCIYVYCVYVHVLYLNCIYWYARELALPLLKVS